MDYNPIKIEEKWRDIWEKDKTYSVDINKAKRPYYNLMMFPYPSAEGLHIGNVYAFTGSDIHGRFMRMRGFDVFEPIGFDAFGIHSENFAIKKGTHPKDQTESNIAHFKEQLKRMGAIFDWDHEVNTSSPDYYKWTQWLFLQLYKAGLAYRAKAPVDWCPSCKTVLADEQVISGRCERCDSIVEQKELEQWFLKITKYADKLLNNLDNVDWSEVVKTAQRNWIGRSEGAILQFSIFNFKFSIPVFTTRPDTLFGATYVVLAPEHDLVDKLKSGIENWDEVLAYTDKARNKTELERADLAKEKTGIELKGIKAINPANNEEIPVWISDYVMASYGTGVIMAVPAHDQRDFEFAKKYNLPVKMVICPNYPDPICPVLDNAYTGEGWLVASGEFNGMPSKEAKEKIMEFVGGDKKVNYHLRDWLISRQRYWGAPIPIMYCRTCWEDKKSKIKNKKEGVDFIIIDNEKYAIVPVPEKDLPVLLPYAENFRPTGTDKSPLATIEEFVKTRCPRCGGEARRETDVCDTFLDSSWYYLGYLSNLGNKKLKIKNKKYPPWDGDVINKWLPVDMYIGGKEHSVLHLMYARFVTMALHDIGLIDFEEPFEKFRAHGLLIREGAKMSKSRGNVISPDDYFESYGVDVLRMYLMFLGPYEQGGDWQDQGIAGIARFIKRVYVLVQNIVEEKSKASKSQIPSFAQELRKGTRNSKSESDLERVTHKTIKKVTEDIENLQYNTAIAFLMEYLNNIQHTTYNIQHTEILLKLLAPFAPHITEELWHEALGYKTSIHNEPWPEYDPGKIKEDKVSVVIQVNGKARSQIEVDRDMQEEKIKSLVLADEKIAKWMGGKSPKKIIIVPGRVVNIVI